MALPIIDSNTLVAIESICKGKRRSARLPRDPWATALAGTFADVVIYEDGFRFTLPRPNKNRQEQRNEDLAPTLVNALARVDPSVVSAEVISQDDKAVVRRLYEESNYEQFVCSVLGLLDQWARRPTNLAKLKRWLKLQRFESIAALGRRQMGQDYFFQLDAPPIDQQLRSVATRLEIGVSDLCWALDSILRVPLYGEKAREPDYYVYHPQREVWPMTVGQQLTRAPNFPISFAPTFRRVSRRLTVDEMASLLLEIRRTIREWGLLNSRFEPREQREFVRELAAKVQLPPRLRKPSGGAVAVGVALLALADGLTQSRIMETSEPLVDLGRHLIIPAGGVVAATINYLNPYLPRSLGSFKMVRPLLSWDIEEEVSGGQPSAFDA